MEELEALSRKKHRARLDAIKASCQAYINGPLVQQLGEIIRAAMETAGVAKDQFRLEPDPADPDRQSLLFWCPAATAPVGDYIRSAMKIEAGAKPAQDPRVATRVKPYVDDDVDLDLHVANITTVQAGRTFWDKVIILHGLRRWHDRRGELRQGGQRISRHYYDVVRLLRWEPDLMLSAGAPTALTTTIRRRIDLLDSNIAVHAEVSRNAATLFGLVQIFT